MGSVSARRLFGGYGLYREATLFAIVTNDTLYFKGDETTREEFIAAGSARFVYQAKKRSIELTYWRAPDACLDDAQTMSRWCTLAWTAARSARRETLRRPPMRGKKAPHPGKPRTRRSR